ncbi:four helix bundle protein [Candidatus Saccharibacteria bacterium]|nr:four helix bundle protein [Candidatus Saccharibacteria bacterium]
MSQEISNPKITDFKDLVAWQKAHRLAVNIYKATEDFPKNEQFGLTNQIRRAAVSVSSNIAEGFGRRTKADRAHFYDMARASLHEVQAQLLIAKDVNFLPGLSYTELEARSVECHKILTGLINKTNE